MPAARLWAYLLAISALWGSSFPLVRYVVHSMPPVALSAGRAGLAAVALALFIWMRRTRFRPGRTLLLHMAVLGTINGWLPNSLNAASLERIGSAQAALIQACGPLMVAVVAAFALGEATLTPRRLAGTALGFAGIAAIFAPLAAAGGGSLAGGLLMLAATASYAGATLYVRWAQPGASPAVALGQQVFSFLPSMALSLVWATPAAYDQPLPVWGVVLLLGVFCSAVPITLQLQLLRTTTASDAALIGYLQPVWATAVAALLLGEWPDGAVLAGGALVLAGVWLASGGRITSRASGAASR